MHHGLGRRSRRIKLHGVGFHSHDRANLCGQPHMRHLRQHGVGEILHHQRHPVRLGPARTEEGAGLGFTGLERHAGPAQFAAQPHVLPVVRALVKEQRFARGATVRIDPVTLQLVGKRLLHIQQHAVNSRVLDAQSVQNGVHIRRLGDRAIEIRGQPIHAVLQRDLPDLYYTRKIPIGIVAAQFDLQTFQAIGLNPVRQQHGVFILRLAAGQFALIQRIHATHQMPGRQLAWRRSLKVILRILTREIHGRAGRRLQKLLQRAAHPLGIVCLVNITFMQLAIGIVQRDIKQRITHQRR